ncbi:MAG: DUF2029 domain-containing protein [Acidimicrobiales bacterium]|nr:DUF2029 domain-containing protein [Acidimicrobiales bacterium]
MTHTGRHAALVVAVGATGLLLVAGSTSTALNLGLLVAAYVGFAGVLVTELRDPWLERRTLYWAAGGLLAVAVVVPPLESRDLWAYAMYGRILGVHHVSPYTNLPADFAGDPLLSSMDTQWQHTPSVYGPWFASLSAIGGALVGESLLGARLFFQGLAAAAVAGVLVLLHRRKVAVAGLVCVALNPLIIVSVVNSGHNDALVGLALLAGVLLAIDRRPAWAGVAFAAAVLVKLAVVLAVVAAVVWLWRRQGLRSMLAASWVFALLVLGSLAAFGGGEAIAPLQRAQLNQTASSIWHAPRDALIDHRVDDGVAPEEAERDARELISKLAQAAVAVGCVVVVLRRWRDPELATLVGAVLLTYAVVGANFLPWYWAWGLPVLALVARSRLTWVALAQGALIEIAMFPVAVGAGGPSALEHLQAWGRDVALPVLEMLVLVALLVRRGPPPQRTVDDTLAATAPTDQPSAPRSEVATA